MSDEAHFDLADRVSRQQIILSSFLREGWLGNVSQCDVAIAGPYPLSCVLFSAATKALFWRLDLTNILPELSVYMIRKYSSCLLKFLSTININASGSLFWKIFGYISDPALGRLQSKESFFFKEKWNAWQRINHLMKNFVSYSSSCRYYLQH
jgi:hypothetical protein